MSGANSRGGPPVERAKFWLDRRLGNLELLDATYVTHSFSRHAHEGFAIGVIEEGAERFYYRGAEHVAPGGQHSGDRAGGDPHGLRGAGDGLDLPDAIPGCRDSAAGRHGDHWQTRWHAFFSKIP